MLSLDEALARVFAAAVPLPAERVRIDDAYGRVLAENAHASQDLPRFDYSAMDGYAVSSGDCTGSGPYRLPLGGESRAGHALPELSRGSACRIFTGAPLPAGADSVVIQEDVERDGDWVSFATPPKAGQHIRRRGEDLRAGALALPAGSRVGAFEQSLLSALDRTEVEVSRKPTLALLSTGDELRAPGAPTAANTIPESNAIAVAALARAAGAEVAAPRHSPDDPVALTSAIEQMALAANVLVTIGGASVGDHDYLRQALSAAGASVDFWKVRIKPGKPLLLGKLGQTIVLGLPGNPVSAQLTFVLFGMPLLLALQGDRRPGPERGRARLGAPVSQKPGRLGLYRARLEGDQAFPLDNQASGSTASLAQADCVVLVPAESSGFPAAADVDIIRLPRP